MRNPARALLLALTLLAASVGASCSDDDAGGSGDVPYLLAQVSGWELTERVDVLPGADVTAPGFEEQDWYTVYERTTQEGDTTTVETITVAGHAAPLDVLIEPLSAQTFEDATIEGREARVGEPVATMGPSTEPAIVALALGDEDSAMLVSYDTPLDELTDFAEALREVDDDTWDAATR